MYQSAAALWLKLRSVLRQRLKIQQEDAYFTQALTFSTSNAQVPLLLIEELSMKRLASAKAMEEEKLKLGKEKLKQQQALNLLAQGPGGGQVSTGGWRQKMTVTGRGWMIERIR